MAYVELRLSKEICVSTRTCVELNPEGFGKLLLRTMPGAPDYQDRQMWSTTILAASKVLTWIGTTPVIPMTLLEPRPRTRILEVLRSEYRVIEVLLTAPYHVLKNRVVDRGAKGTDWCIEELPRFFSLATRISPTITIDTTTASPSDAVEAIMRVMSNC